MVSIKGAQDAQPIATEIVKLQDIIASLENLANPGTSRIWKISIEAYDGSGKSNSITIHDDINAADSTAILFDIRNILGNKLQIQNNALTAIA